MRRYLPIVATLIIAQGWAVALADEGLALLPPECTLQTPQSVQHLLVQRTTGGEPTRQVTQGIAWTSSDPHVAEVADGVVTPVGDGEALITARVGDQAATMKVIVAGV